MATPRLICVLVTDDDVSAVTGRFKKFYLPHTASTYDDATISSRRPSLTLLESSIDADYSSCRGELYIRLRDLPTDVRNIFNVATNYENYHSLWSSMNYYVSQKTSEFPNLYPFFFTRLLSIILHACTTKMKSWAHNIKNFHRANISCIFSLFYMKKHKKKCSGQKYFWQYSLCRWFGGEHHRRRRRHRRLSILSMCG